MKSQLRQYIQETLLENGAPHAVQDDENLLGSGLVDSVGMMSLVLFIEETFGVAVPPEDVTIEHFLSIDTIATYLEARVAA